MAQMIELEQMITDAYDLHIAQKRDEKQQRIAQEQARRQTAIAQFRERFDLVFSADLQNAMGIKVEADNLQTFATFTYQGTEFNILRFGQDDWKVERIDNGATFVANSHEIVNSLLITLGAVRATFSRKQMTLEEAADKITFSLSQVEHVYDHSADFIYQPEDIEAFGAKLRNVIVVLEELSIDLCSKLESKEQ